MYKNSKIAVIIPAFNEELLIGETLTGLPSWMDYIIVIDDCSKDKTPKILESYQNKDSRIIIINHRSNLGLGQSLIDGYLRSLETDADITVVMAGDNQMDPLDLPNLLDKLIDEKYDYVKGNRLLHQNVSAMPKYRFIGNSILTILTKFATGYYFMMDPQCGYTAINNKVLKNIPIQNMTKGYGYNADILCMLNIQGYSVADVEVKPIYDREKSKIKLWKYIPKTSWILINLFFRRLWKRYVVLDFHPLVLFWLFSFISIGFVVTPCLIRFIYIYFFKHEFPSTTFTILSISMLMTLQTILFAIWMDMDYNKSKK